LAGGGLLAGERGAVKVPGFDLGNSPVEYGRDNVEGKTIVLTTTNGTRAFQAVEGARVIVATAFLNGSAAARWLMRAGLDVLIVCAGQRGRFCLEDAVGGGMLIEGLRTNFSWSTKMTFSGCSSVANGENTSSRKALDRTWRSVRGWIPPRSSRSCRKAVWWQSAHEDRGVSASCRRTGKALAWPFDRGVRLSRGGVWLRLEGFPDPEKS
jgi:hypothetical protein